MVEMVFYDGKGSDVRWEGWCCKGRRAVLRWAGQCCVLEGAVL